MKASLFYLELENFKSYRGKSVITTRHNFIAVIGPNGSGKSNLTDAISFVMGEKPSRLRVRNLKELIHGAQVGDPVSSRASVTAVFRLENGSEQRFCRAVQGSSSEFRVNNEVVTGTVYIQELEKLGVNVKANTFLVYQGTVESIVMMNPKERTDLFEEASGSIRFKADYDKLKTQMLKCEEEIICMYEKKRSCVREHKDAKKEVMKAEQYERLKDDLVDAKVELQLFKLYHNQEDIQKIEIELVQKQGELRNAKKEKEEAEVNIRNTKKEHGKLIREVTMLEQRVREHEMTLNKMRPALIKAKQGVDHVKGKLRNAQKSLAEAQKVQTAQNETKNDLQLELEKVETARQDYEEQVKGESQSQGRDLQLEDSQVNEYNHLKREAVDRTGFPVLELLSVDRDIKNGQDCLDNEERLRSELQTKIKQLIKEKDESMARAQKLTDFVSSVEIALEEKINLKDNLKATMETNEEQVPFIQKELEETVELLGEVKDDKERKRKQEAIEALKNHFPGVFGRLMHMCKPIHQKYSLALTKVLGKYMDAIVVDCEETARNCIGYLKTFMMDREIFLPIDYVKTKPLNRNLQRITDPKNVHLLYDVLTYAPPDIKPAILFATNNTVVCDTPEDAMYVAYEFNPNQYNSAVALDGTHFQKSGILSGGSFDLAKKARQWDEKQKLELKAKREKLKEQLSDLTKKCRQESQLNSLACEIKNLEVKLKYSKADCDKALKQAESCDIELQNLNSKMEVCEHAIAKIRRSMETLNLKKQNLQHNVDSIEDEIFRDFCATHGIANIRQFEERELRFQQERAERLMEFKEQKNRIQSQLAFEETRDSEIAEKVSRWEHAVEEFKRDLQTAKQAEQEQLQLMECAEKEMENVKAEILRKQSDVKAKDEIMINANCDVQAISKIVLANQKKVIRLEGKITRLKVIRHSLLRQSKMDDILIPMHEGSMDDIEINTEKGSNDSENQTSSNTTSSSVRTSDRESRISVDYSGLSEGLKGIDDDEFENQVESMQHSIRTLLENIRQIQLPNLKSAERQDETREKLKETAGEFEMLRTRAQKIKHKFEKVKKGRYDHFMKCFDHVAGVIDDIYKHVNWSQSGVALLTAENAEEPYLGGITVCCVVPGKSCQQMQNLSGGEMTVASISLLMAIQSFQPAPLFVLDEIDAALDNINIRKVARYLQERAASLQTIVISLKEEFFIHADALIGICPDGSEDIISRALHFDLTKYPL